MPPVLIPILLASVVVAAVAMTRRPAAPPVVPTPQPDPRPPAPVPASPTVADLLARYNEMKLQFRLDRSVMRAGDVRSVAAQLAQAGRTTEAAELEAIAEQLR